MEPAESTSDSAEDADRSAGAGVEWLRSGPAPSPPPPAAAARGSSVPWPAQVAELQLSSGDMYEWGLMHKLLVSYTRLVQRTVTDLVPKAITHRLVDTALHKLRHLAAPPPRVASGAREQVTPPLVASPPPPRRHPHFAHAEAQRVCTCSGTCYMRMRMRM